LSQTEKPQNNQKKRNYILLSLALFFLLSGAAYVFYYYTYSRFYESTDNAYVGQNIVYVTPQVSGNVDAIYVSEMQNVKAGEKMAHLDSRDAQLAFLSAKEALAQSVRQIKQTKMLQEEAKNAISLAQVNLNKTKADLERNNFLLSKGAITGEKFQNLEFAKDAADANLQMANKKLLSIDVLLKDKDISKNPEIQNAILRVQKTYLDLRRCDILAPVSGMIAKKNLSLGESVTSNATILSIVPQEDFWVDANFKETQLQHIRIDQDVELVSDLYGKDMTFHGKIVGIAAGTGAVFSLLPAQNASGNWIKIVQRVPVRITLDPKEVKSHPLQVGNSMSVTVDLHKQNGGYLKRVASKDENNLNYKLYDNSDNEAKALIKEIIEQNL
jgi:membrane fusion protein (multidrug efflux system)